MSKLPFLTPVILPRNQVIILLINEYRYTFQILVIKKMSERFFSEQITKTFRVKDSISVIFLAH